MLFISFVMLFAFQTTVSSMGFLEMAKNNPRAFIDAVDTADPGAVNTIIVILQGMINEAQSRSDGLTEELKKAKDALTAGELEDEAQGEKCEAIKVNMTEKKKIMDRAQGVFTTTKKARDARVPVLNKELAILKDVLTKVKTLETSSQNKSRRLLALDTELTLAAIKENPQSFLETLVDADPKKVAKVIELIELLISQAEADKAQLIGAFNDANKALGDAIVVFKDVQTNHGVCVAAQQATGDEVDKLEAALEATQKYHDEWQTKFSNERATLKEIIRLLKTTIEE